MNYNASAVKPADPSRAGYTYGGWYTDEALTTAFDFTAAIKENITLYAKWTINSYKVGFNTNGGSTIATKTVEYDTAVTEPSDPTKAGYTFVGWYTDRELTKAYDFSGKVTRSFTLYAKWTINSYKVGFNTNGGSRISTKTVKYNGTVTKPSNPTRTGYTFGGWYTDRKCTKAYSFSTKVTKSRTLYAKWYKVTLNVSTLKLKKGQSTTAVKATLSSGDKIKSWKSSNKKVVLVNSKGKIKALRTGTATIMVRTVKGATDKIKVTVQKGTVKTTRLTVKNVINNKISIRKGKVFYLKTSVTPITSQQAVTYKSSKKSVATVNSSGRITARGMGITKITITSGSKTVTIAVTVK